MRFLFPLATMMVRQAASGEGGGGGGGAPAGDGANGGGDAPQYVTKAEFNEMLNKAFGAREKRSEAKIQELLGGFTKGLEERLASLAPKPPEEQAPGGTKVDPEVVKLKQTTESLTKALETERKAREAAEAKSRNEKANALLSTALGKHVRPEVVGVLLKAMRGDVQFGEDGEPVFPLPDGTGTSTIDAAIEAWAKSNDAKPFLPAPNAGGAGTVRGGGNVGSQDYKTKPRSQWTPADQEAAFRANVAANAAKNV